MRLVRTSAAWEDHVHRQAADRRLLERISALLNGCVRDPFAGIGRPEQPRCGASGAWSRRTTDEHRLVDLVVADDLVGLPARYRC
ncbi:MAG TPA: Txe/YoeB family addiction module toxin [Cellulomonas sp.]